MSAVVLIVLRCAWHVTCVKASEGGPVDLAGVVVAYKDFDAGFSGYRCFPLCAKCEASSALLVWTGHVYGLLRLSCSAEVRGQAACSWTANRCGVTVLLALFVPWSCCTSLTYPYGAAIKAWLASHLLSVCSCTTTGSRTWGGQNGRDI